MFSLLISNIPVENSKKPSISDFKILLNVNMFFSNDNKIEKNNMLEKMLIRVSMVFFSELVYIFCIVIFFFWFVFILIFILFLNIIPIIIFDMRILKKIIIEIFILFKYKLPIVHIKKIGFTKFV